MTTALARARTWPAPARNKYRAVKVTIDGHRFDSKREASVYGELKLRERAGEISLLEVHPKFPITVKGHHVADYTADFAFYEAGNGVVVDVKSKPTAAKRDFILIRKLMKAVHNIDVEVWT